MLTQFTYSQTLKALVIIETYIRQPFIKLGISADESPYTTSGYYSLN